MPPPIRNIRRPDRQNCAPAHEQTLSPCAVLMSVILLLGFLIRYPDTVDGQISVTATTAPVRLVANSNGRIHLLKTNKSQLQKGDVISYLESGADYKHILWVDTALNLLKADASAKISLPDTLILGEVSSAYNAFLRREIGRASCRERV